MLDATGRLQYRTFAHDAATQRANAIGGTVHTRTVADTPAPSETPASAHEIHAVLDTNDRTVGWVWREHSTQHGGHEHWAIETTTGYRSPFGYSTKDLAIAAVLAVGK